MLRIHTLTILQEEQPLKLPCSFFAHYRKLALVSFKGVKYFHANNIISIFEDNGNGTSVTEMYPTGEFPDRMVQKAAVWVLGPLCLVEVHNYVSSTAPL